MYISRVKHWNLKYFYNRIQRFLYEIRYPDHPWLTQEANKILNCWIRKTDVGFEWGSGRSTIWFAKRVKHLISIEHDPYWYKKVENTLTRNNIKNVSLYFFEVPKKYEIIGRTPYMKYNYEEISILPYVNVIDSFPDESLDFVLVDGLFRAECSLKALNKIKPNGLLIIDNVNWFLPSTSSSPASRSFKDGPISQRWALLKKFLKSWRCIWTSDGVIDTAIYVKP